MNTWLIALLVLVGVFLLVEIGLVLAGKKELAKKLVLPFVLLGGALAVFLKLPDSSAIKKENERIKRELAKIKEERDALRKEIEDRTKEFEEKSAALREQIQQNDEQEARLKSQIATMKAQGAEVWFKSLHPDKQKEIWEEVDRPGLPDEFLNP